MKIINKKVADCVIAGCISISIDVSYDPNYRVPTVKELQKAEIWYICDTLLTMENFNSSVKDLCLPIISDNVVFVKNIRNNFVYYDIEYYQSLLDRGLIVIERQDEDLIRVYIKKKTSSLCDPWIVEWTYWSYKYWRKKLSTFNNPNDILSVVFDESVAMYEIISKL